MLEARANKGWGILASKYGETFDILPSIHIRKTLGCWFIYFTWLRWWFAIRISHGVK